MDVYEIIDKIISQYGGWIAATSAIIVFFSTMLSNLVSTFFMKLIDSKFSKGKLRYDTQIEQYLNCVRPISEFTSKLVLGKATIDDKIHYEEKRIEAIALLGIFSSTEAVQNYMEIIRSINNLSSFNPQEKLYSISEDNFRTVSKKALVFINSARKEIGVAKRYEQDIKYDFEK
ncbi:hypothetical protein [Endozoicomonas atrinae]|uniref:hypothetical protein n=1 Tax=Endozoicomonas atrinae TaxID=1333660 RepID=UPI000825C88C|nr:hypothetical protein [Endozoicomonas atrinae]